MTTGAMPMTMSVPEFGATYLGLGRDASYVAADNGLIIEARVGRSRRVVLPVALKHLGWSDDLIARAIGLEPERTNDALAGAPLASVTVLTKEQVGPHGAPHPA